MVIPTCDRVRRIKSASAARKTRFSRRPFEPFVVRPQKGFFPVGESQCDPPTAHENTAMNTGDCGFRTYFPVVWKIAPKKWPEIRHFEGTAANK